jgi:uncharacterized membrane protein
VKKALSLIIFTIIAFLNSSSYINAQESITNYTTENTINLDGTVSIKEVITYDFGTAQKHGIFRFIPLSKKNEEGKEFKMSISGITVTDDSGLPFAFTTSEADNKVTIKIGDANKFVTGKVKYHISYKISGALTYFSEHDEFYWNVTGNDSQVAIKSVTAETQIPSGVLKEQAKAVCFTGVSGSTESRCTITPKGNRLKVISNNELAPGEGLTLAVRFPPGVVSKLEPVEIVPYKASFFQKLVGFIFSLLLIVGLAFWNIIFPIKIFLKWNKDHKNTKQKQRIVSAWFSSPETLDDSKLSPAETSCLIDKSVDNKDITATLIELAQRGFLKIVVSEKKEVTLNLLKQYKAESGLLDYEQTILDGFFKDGSLNTRSISDISGSTTFLKYINAFKKQVSLSLIKHGFFVDNIEKVGLLYSVVGMFALFTINIPLAIVAFIFGRKSALKTDLGVEKYSEAMSLRNFLVSQDAQINFQSQNQMFFEKLLPYATAFGVEKVWAKRFEKMNFQPSDWYEGDLHRTLLATTITSSINRAVGASMTTSTHSSSGFSSGFSGGHSGGGGGGGGTGSW